ncbi:MAG: hypothetical protein V1911_04370 [Candidatus Micrarchaeota archaeon]
MSKPSKSDAIKAVNQSKSVEILQFNHLTDHALAMKALTDAIDKEYTVIILK